MEPLLIDAAAKVEALARVMPDWLFSAVALLLAAAAALLLHVLLHRSLTRFVARRDLFWRSLVSRSANPLRLILVVAALALLAPLVPFTSGQKEIFRHVLLLGVIAVLMWLAQLVLHIFTTLHLRRFKLDTDDNFLARKHVTQSRILQRVASTLIVIVGIGAMLTTFEAVRQYGISLLASAGAAGIVVGLALQPLLKNLFAGIQLAITQPIRIDDALIVEGEYGNVEEITSTYVVVRTWDRRRLIVPLNYFMERPFQNWTREDTALTGEVYLYLDFSVPVAALRRKAQEIVRASPLWDGDIFSLQVTDFRENTMQLRILASAANSGAAFDLRCQIREELITYLNEHFPHALPRFRAELDGAQRVMRQEQDSYQGDFDRKGSRQ
ncbi:mechanosensitive ion channel family protein [Chelativorans sp.]|uniref:mechanosensitive ion channel family protein n=1 Tax=Chelativorans sp. TaxID=2203393 RepID=UPI002812237A|nr:mechanosensitive ion channel family protein [Chelativorans sp.]